MQLVKLGVIGCGIAAQELHWPALKKMKDDFRIVMACNHTKRKAQIYSDLVGGVPYVTDYRELIDNDNVEAVSIALPFHLNLEVTRAALEAGKHVIVEKPLASTMDEARQMVELEKNYPDVVTMVAENFRYRHLYHRVKEIINGGLIGKPYSVLWNYFFYVNPDKNKYAQTSWRMEERYPGGFIVDAGVHNVAVLRQLFGEFISGRALTRSVTPALGRFDTFTMQFTMDSGLDGVMNLFYSAKGVAANSLHIFGDKGTIIVERDSLVVKMDDMSDRREVYDDDMGYMAEFENFYDSIRSGKDIVSTFAEAYRDLEYIDGGVRSAIEGETVYF